jgi:hypothetical protein
MHSVAIRRMWRGHFGRAGDCSCTPLPPPGLERCLILRELRVGCRRGMWQTAEHRADAFGARVLHW